MSSTPLKTVKSFLHSFQSGIYLGSLPFLSYILPRQDIIYRCLAYEKSWFAQSTQSTKQLGQVRGSTRKPFPQKGRGKARVGTIRSPQFRGGYTVHGPRPALRTTNIQRKVYNLGLRSCLSIKYNQAQMFVVDKLSIESPEKGVLKDILEKLGLRGKKIYFLHGDEGCINMLQAVDKFVKKPKSPTNPDGEKGLLMSHARHISCRKLLEYDYLVMDKEALEYLDEKYAPKSISVAANGSNSVQETVTAVA